MEQGLTYFKLGGTKGSVSLWFVVCTHGKAVVGGTPGGPALSPHLNYCGQHACRDARSPPQKPAWTPLRLSG